MSDIPRDGAVAAPAPINTPWWRVPLSRVAKSRWEQLRGALLGLVCDCVRRADAAHVDYEEKPAKFLMCKLKKPPFASQLSLTKYFKDKVPKVETQASVDSSLEEERSEEEITEAVASISTTCSIAR